MEARLFQMQRLSALIMAPLVLGHLALIIVVSGEALSAADILARTQGSWALGLYYGLFVVMAAIHAPIGLRAIIREWTPWSGRALDGAMALFGLVLLALGGRALFGLVLT